MYPHAHYLMHSHALCHMHSHSQCHMHSHSQCYMHSHSQCHMHSATQCHMHSLTQCHMHSVCHKCICGDLGSSRPMTKWRRGRNRRLMTRRGGLGAHIHNEPAVQVDNRTTLALLNLYPMYAFKQSTHKFLDTLVLCLCIYCTHSNSLHTNSCTP